MFQLRMLICGVWLLKWGKQKGKFRSKENVCADHVQGLVIQHKESSALPSMTYLVYL